nr:hypothetical protein [Tanacetum cinerariifolium]
GGGFVGGSGSGGDGLEKRGSRADSGGGKSESGMNSGSYLKVGKKGSLGTFTYLVPREALVLDTFS